MKINVLIVFLVVFCSLIKAQTNLVPNGSFETYTLCPTTLSSFGDDEVSRVIGWYSSSKSPDFFHTCSSSTVCEIPTNVVGYQYASEGNSYCGIIAYSKTGFYREILSASLSSTMIVANKYYFSMKVSLAENYYFKYCGVDNLGLLFSTKKYDLTAPSPINNYAHLHTSNIIIDTLNWVTIYGSFIADSSYSYINVGNFYDDVNTNKIILNSTASDSYYYIDDIRVSTDSIFGLSVYTEELNFKNTLCVFPNPTSDKIYVKTNKKILKLEIYNEIGMLILEKEKETEISLNHLPLSFYYIKVLFYDSTFILRKIIKNQ